MPKEERPKKIKYETFPTRHRAERQLTAGADPEAVFTDSKGTKQKKYLNHPNYHVRTRAWVKMGRPLPEGEKEVNDFLLKLYGKELPKNPDDHAALYAKVRQIYLHEAPITENAPLPDTTAEVMPG
jgi:hypothetical protein